MPERDQGHSAVATLPTAPAKKLDRPTRNRDHPRSAPARPIGQRKQDNEGEWPLRSYLQLGALPGAVPCARLHAKLVLWEWGLDHLAETAELLVSEIVTNAVRVSAGPASGQGGGQRQSGLPTVWFWLAANGRDVLVQVWDGSPEKPVWHDVGPRAESGRGLMLVERLSDRWGSYTPDGWSGKVVWATISDVQEHRRAS
jgi:hypothetical protein